jgi:hypothetical protein
MHQKISAHWLTDGLLDAEYKQYMMLAWLQKVKKEFRKTHLYPSLGDLVEAHRGLRQFKEERDRWGELMQGELQGLDFQKMRWVYGQIQAHPDLDAYLDELLQFAIPRLRESIEEGAELYNIIEDHLELTPVGITPLYADEGYLLVYDEPESEIYGYRYRRSKILLEDEPYLQLELTPVDQRRRSLAETFESIKLEFARKFTDLPNPATYLARCSFSFPLEPSVLPVVRRSLLRRLQAA